MMLSALMVTLALAAGPQVEPSSQAAAQSTEADVKETGDLPVSLDRIRDALDRPAPISLRKAVDDAPTFRVEIRERLKIEELLASLDFKAGPTPAGGIYAFEQQRLATPAVDNPLAQPYAAFTQGQLLTILVENLVGKYAAGKAIESLTKAQREHAEASARKEVDTAVAEYCATKPNDGAGIPLCDSRPGSSSPAR
jgi:hypothetical protein